MVALAYPRVDRLGEISAHDVDILPHLHKDHRQTGILTDRDPLLCGDTGVFDQLVEDFLPLGRFLLLQGPVKGRQHVLSEVDVGIDEQVLHGLGDLGC